MCATGAKQIVYQKTVCPQMNKWFAAAKVTSLESRSVYQINL